MPTITISIPRKRSLDAGKAPSLKELYAELAERVWGAIQAAKASSKTGDEAAGHHFHGNQYVKVAGAAKPEAKDLKEKSAKGKLRELLESGHAWTQQELMDITGIDKEATFKAFIYYMRTPKFAGKKGALDVVKDKSTGLWGVQMALGNGEHEPLKEAKAAIEKVAHHGPAPVATKAAEPAPEPEEKQKPSPLGAMTGAQAGSMPKAEADKLYAQHMAEANDTLIDHILSMEGHTPEQAQAATNVYLKHWKKKKAAGMLAWAQAVHGVKGNAVPAQEIFQADLQLAKDLQNGDGFDKAFAKWKNNTANEKAGTWPPKAVAEKPKATDMQHSVPVQAVPYEQLVPKSHEHISMEDMQKGRFSKGISKAKSFLAGQGSNGIGNKKTVEQKLRERLKDKPNFQALVQRLGLIKEGQGSAESRLVSAWASSSGNGNPLSVALQLAARDAFSIPDGHVEKKALTSLQHLDHEDQVYAQGFQSLNPNIEKLKPAELPVVKEALKEFVQAQYHETQDMLKAEGIEHMFLVRGMKYKEGESQVQLKLQPASSFSTNYATAKSFAGSGTVFVAKVPRTQIMSTYVSGFGCTSEHEVVVLAHQNMRAFAVPSQVAAGQLQAQEWLAGKAK